MSLADYLAKNYLTADKPSSGDKKSKKRKRRGTTLNTATSGLTIADDDLDGWSKNNGAGNDSDDDMGPTISGIMPTKAKTTAWKKIGTAAPSNKEQEAADAIIAAAAKENEDARLAEDDAPTVEDMDGIGDAAGLYGLKTGAEVSAHIRKKKEVERRKYQEEEAAGVGTSSKETIYRDASGRVINVAMKRAEARKKADEEAERKRELDRAARGDVQLAESAANAQRLQDAKFITVARGVDDVEMNEELKERERWNDPAMAFLSEGAVAAKSKRRSKTGRPLYRGAAEPNRYGILPGYRWDGVDRGNGFEKKWFAARNKQRDQRELEYAWQMDE